MANLNSQLLSRPHAAALQEPSPVDHEGVAWHYGAPLVEQRVIETGTGVVDRSQRSIISVAGPDAPTFLNNLLSQKLDDVLPGFSAQALDLDGQGRILHHADITRTEDTFYLDVPRAQAASLMSYLQKMVFWSEVTISETNLALLTLLGAPIPLPDCAFSREVNWAGPRRVDLAVDHTLIDATVSQLEAAGATLIGLMAFTAERVKALEPELAADLDDKSIPHEVPNFIGSESNPAAVHLAKGCYRGQETVSRVHNLGRSPRVLVLVHLDGSAPTLPTTGAEITAGGRKVGRLGTVIDDCDLGPIALALIKRSALSSELLIGDVSAAVDSASLPTDDTTERPGRAAINRLRGQS
ncbi:CAF17-like 4Fe-4S cluster assembly/insertion protein YgfZ [Corynebacterium sp. H128]|uniref:CAF17-like 4Fe-4S cluster assembly/insertion protein YgfZ n=1 Tax=Corynebacterium sp. H128 TaxID=3133427 RepID=UPI00403F0F42